MAGEHCVLLTDRIRQCICDVSKREIPSESLKSELCTYVEDEQQQRTHIPFRIVKAIYELHKKNNANEKPLYLHELLNGSEIHLPPPTTPERSKELEARIQKLRIEQENREYRQMTKGISDQQPNYLKSDVQSFGQEMKEVNKQVMAIFNFLITVGGAFAFGFVASGLMGSGSLQSKMISGSMLAFVVFIADMYFLLKYEV